MEYRTIQLEKRDRIYHLTLNRPDALNALSPELIAEARSALARVRQDEEAKALVVRGEGRAFSAGADLKFMKGAIEGRDERLVHVLREVNEWFFELEALPIPTVAVVKGFALAGGLELVMACDLALAAEDAVLGDQHINYALMPGGGNTQRLPRKVGLQKALYLMFTGGWLTGKQAEEWGLVLKAVPAERLEEEVEALLAQLRDKSRHALSAIKRAVYRGIQMSNWRDAVDHEVAVFHQYVASSDHVRQGLQAFAEKRRPSF